MPRLLLFLATQKGFRALQYLIKNNLREHIGFVVTFHEDASTKNWGTLILEECKNFQIPCFLWAEAKNSISDLSVSFGVTGAVAISWRYLLPLELNNILKYPLIVFHDSLLPRYRGFAPTPTAIMAGEKEIGVTAFFAVDEVDAGDIIAQTKMQVSRKAHMKEIIDEQSEIYATMLEKIIFDMKAGKIEAVPQNEDDATYSIWRNAEDYQIDWTKNSEEIYNFVRALGSPYPNAFTYYNGQKIDVLEVKVVPDKNFVIRDCGKIWSLKDNKPEIICGSGMVKILSAVNSEGEKISFKRLRCRLGADVCVYSSAHMEEPALTTNSSRRKENFG